MTCPNCGYCPTCGRPRYGYGRWFQYPYAVPPSPYFWRYNVSDTVTLTGNTVDMKIGADPASKPPAQEQPEGHCTC